MGFRNYSPGLNRFLSRDSYNGALADMNLGLNPFTGNRYAYGGGNPISAVEIDGHCWGWAEGICEAAETAADWVEHNADTLTDMSIDALEFAAGTGATYAGVTMMAAGVSACVASTPFVVTVVGTAVTAGACSGGAALAGAGVLTAGLGMGMMMDGGSKFVDNAGRLENPPSSKGEESGGSPRVTKTNGLDPGDRNLRRDWDSNGTTYQINTGHGFNRAHRTGTDLRSANLTPDQVEQAIIADLEKFRSGGGALPQVGRNVGTAERTIDVDGKSITYNAVQIGPDRVGVSTYWLN